MVHIPPQKSGCFRLGVAYGFLPPDSPYAHAPQMNTLQGSGALIEQDPAVTSYSCIRSTCQWQKPSAHPHPIFHKITCQTFTCRTNGQEQHIVLTHVSTQCLVSVRHTACQKTGGTPVISYHDLLQPITTTLKLSRIEFIDFLLEDKYLRCLAHSLLSARLTNLALSHQV